MMKEFVKQLTKEQVENILKNILGENFHLDGARVLETNEDTRPIKAEHWGNTELYEIWGKLEKGKLNVYAFDYDCYWNVTVIIDDFSLSIPKYENGFAGIGNSKEDQVSYIKEMTRIFGKKYIEAFYNHLHKTGKTKGCIDEKTK